jgi:hypothetical protein
VGLLRRFRRRPAPHDLLGRELFIALPPTTDLSDEPNAPLPRELDIRVVEDDDGVRTMPVFTSEEALAPWIPEGSPYVALEGRVVLELFVASDCDHLHVHGADRDAYEISREGARSLLGVEPITLPAGAEVRIGQPAQPFPDALITSIRLACDGEPRIREAYLYQVEYAETAEPPHPAIGLVVIDGVSEAEFRDIGSSINAQLDLESAGYAFIDIGSLAGELLALVRTSGPPIFTSS